MLGRVCTIPHSTIIQWTLNSLGNVQHEASFGELPGLRKKCDGYSTSHHVLKGGVIEAYVACGNHGSKRDITLSQKANPYAFVDTPSNTSTNTSYDILSDTSVGISSAGKIDDPLTTTPATVHNRLDTRAPSWYPIKIRMGGRMQHVGDMSAQFLWDELNSKIADACPADHSTGHHVCPRAFYKHEIHETHYDRKGEWVGGGYLKVTVPLAYFPKGYPGLREAFVSSPKTPLATWRLTRGLARTDSGCVLHPD
jgi:hypothetical protein